MRVPLIDGQGNFGSVDGDTAAAMRYTESRLTKIAQTLLDDIDKDTVDFQPNYDNREKEPSVLPAKFPEPSGQRRRRHRGRHGDQHPAAQSRRSHRRLRGADRQSRARHRRSHQHHSGSGFPDRRHHPRTPGHPLGLSPRPRLDRDARQGHDRHHPQGSRSDHHHRNSLPGEQGHHGRAHRRTGAREEDRGHLRSARRIRPRRFSRRRRTEARRGAGRRAEPALPFHAAADQFSAPTWWRSMPAGRR